MKKRIHNFSAGPAKIPDEVMYEVQDELYSYQGKGYSICEIGHRTKIFEDILNTVIEDFRQVMKIPKDYHVIFVSSGASIHYAMLPYNFSPRKNAAYVNTGIWSQKAIAEARKIINVTIPASSEETGFDRIPEVNETFINQGTDYLHITTNNTIYGTEFHEMPRCDSVPLIADMTSDIVSREMDVSKFGMLYAGTQKNLGISGLSLAVIRPDLLERTGDKLPSLLNYNTYVKNNSMFNTPNTFGIYIAGKVLKWIKNKGGLKLMESVNRKKAEKLYQVIDNSSLYTSKVKKSDRSLMNITFFLDSRDNEKRFLSEAEKQELLFLKGHRLNGGIRASVYNATEMDSVDALADFMIQFEKNKL